MPKGELELPENQRKMRLSMKNNVGMEMGKVLLNVWCCLVFLFAASGLVQAQQHKPLTPSSNPPQHQTNAAPKVSNPAPKLNLQLAPLGRQAHSQSSYAPIVKKVEPSVVTVYSTKTVPDTAHNPLANNPLFRHFFGQGSEDEEEDDSSTPAAPSTPHKKQEQSLGSGIIVTPDGYILSNSHVVEDADEVKVSLADGITEYTAKVIGSDPPTDISVLKIDGTNLPAIAITDSTSLEVGDTVLAIGNPFGVGQTVTLGIVSAMGRGGFGITDYEDFIQTDASINPGNSGGALVDVEGRLVGVPTAILSRTGGNVGIGFAVPVNMARTVMDLIVKNGRVVRGYLGVYVQSISPGLKQAFKLPDRNGALISGVAPNSPAATGGLREGDVITAMNGHKVDDSRHLRLLIGQSTPNTKTTVTVWREGQQKDFTATLGELPTEQVTQAPQKPTPTGRTTDMQLGLQLRNLEPGVRQELKLPAANAGVLVEGVERSAPAYAAGLRPGDIILEVNRKPVQTAQEAFEASKAQPSANQVLFKVWSKGGSRFVVVETGKKEK